jgi:hypothetical protein
MITHTILAHEAPDTMALATREWVWCRSSFGTDGNRHVILTLIEPISRDRRYLVANDRQYALLKSGMSVDDLDLYEIEDEDDA